MVLVVAIAITGVTISKLQALDDPDVVLFNPAPYMTNVQAATQGYSNLDYYSAEGVMVDGIKMVRVPGPEYGGAAVTLDSQGNVTSVLVTENSVNKSTGQAHSKVYLDGTQIGELWINTSTGVVANGWMLKDGQQVSYAGFDPFDDEDARIDVTWSCFRNCLINMMGVPTWLIGLAGAVCSAVCVLTVGTGCVVCLQGVLIAYGAEIAFCLGYCR